MPREGGTEVAGAEAKETTVTPEQLIRELGRGSDRFLLQRRKVLGLSAMATGEAPLVAARASDPAMRSPADWIADLVPHLTYGQAAVVTFETGAG